MRSTRLYVILSFLYLFIAFVFAINYQKPITRLETGNFSELLAGIVSPLAFFWFIYAVLLQRQSNISQDIEFQELLRVQQEHIAKLSESNNISRTQAIISVDNYNKNASNLLKQEFDEKLKIYYFEIFQMIKILRTSECARSMLNFSENNQLEDMQMELQTGRQDDFLLILSEILRNFYPSNDQYKIIASEITKLFQRKELFQTVFFIELGLHRIIANNREREKSITEISIGEIKLVAIESIISNITKIASFLPDGLESIQKDLEKAMEENTRFKVKMDNIRNELEESLSQYVDAAELSTLGADQKRDP